MNKVKAIITGATGMVGENVIHECLQNSDVEKVLAITRKPTGIKHHKFNEIIHQDLSDIRPIVQLMTGFNACYFCMGISAVGKKEDEYTKYTYSLTMNFARILAEQNPEMTFCYISGMGTDSSEKGNVMWARVKGKTENDLMKLPFKQVYNLRLAAALASLPVKPTQTYYSMYKYFSWLFVFLKLFAPNMVNRLDDLARVMISLTKNGYPKNILESKDINTVAKEIMQF